MRYLLLSVFALFVLLCNTACPRADQPAAGVEVQTAAGVPAPVIAPRLTPAPYGGEALFLPTEDGCRTAAWYWAPLQTGAPGVILVHMRGGNKGTWGDMPKQLVEEGFAVIAIDLRGHGESIDPAGRRLDLNALKEADYLAMLGDIAAAHRLFEQRNAVDADRVGLVGASIGANLAMMYAAGDLRVRTVVALSPGLNYMGLQPLKYLAGLDKRALYLVAATGDEYSFSGCQELEKLALSDPVSFRSFEGKEHGTDLLDAHPGLGVTIVSGWLLNHLPPRGVNIT